MTFTISIRELVAALMILPPSMQTSATYIYAQFEQGDLSLGMAMAVITVSGDILKIPDLPEALFRRGKSFKP